MYIALVDVAGSWSNFALGETASQFDEFLLLFGEIDPFANRMPHNAPSRNQIGILGPMGRSVVQIFGTPQIAPHDSQRAAGGQVCSLPQNCLRRQSSVVKT